MLEKYLQSYSVEALQGFAFCADALKSLILSVACVERRLSVRNIISKLFPHNCRGIFIFSLEAV